MKLCGGTVGFEQWFGIKFDTKTEAENVMEFLEKGIRKTSKVDAKQTDKEKGKKNE